MPADRRRIENNLGAAKRRQPGGFGEPLIPADEHAEPARGRIESAKAEITGREIELLVVAGIVGDVHLPVLANIATGGIDDGGRVVEDAGGAALEEARDDGDPEISRERLDPRRARARHGLGELEVIWIFDLAEVRRQIELRQTYQAGAGRRRLADAGFGRLGVIGLRLSHRHLDEPDAQAARNRRRAHD